MRFALAALLVLVGAGCGNPAPRALRYGADECRHCHMQLADPRFGGEVVTTTGKTHPFDDVGCLGTFVLQGGLPGETIHSLWVVDFLTRDTLLAVTDAVFLLSDSVRTPMQYGLAATRPGPAADSLAAAWQAQRLDWDGVLAHLGARGS